MEFYLYVALFAPLVGSLFSALFTAKKANKITGYVASFLLFVSFVASGILLYDVWHGGSVHVHLMTWINTGGLYIPFGFIVDNISVTMMMVVTTVSMLVHIYSIGYMDHDEGFNRFFSYLSAFVFSMMILVMSDNFAGLFIGWEGVGLCSWLLIGFWYHKESASWAANEAFIMNRIADVGMLIGIFMIYYTTGSLQYDKVFAALPSASPYVVTLIGSLLFIGAMGKSAQFPLHTWLADAMEGPTPVSALIHAATMVTAGVFLIIRSHALYQMIPNVGEFIASLGAFVAIFAASMALVNRDIKRIVAYSTLSQLGYMFVAAGLGAYWIALFHLVAHAFFKSLLFLGAGNVMHAMDDELDPFKMGGLGKKMKWTLILMVIASMALAGLVPFAGFFSKDPIIEASFVSHHYIIYATIWITAGLTAFYSFRMIGLVFFGEERYKIFGFHPHEAYRFMLLAMAPLGILSIIIGFFRTPFYDFITNMLPSTIYEVHPEALAWGMNIATQALVVLFIWYPWQKYAKFKGADKVFEQHFIYKLLFNQYYIPNFYNKCIVVPYTRISNFFWMSIDLKIVDATVDLIANTLYKTGKKTRYVQDGNLSSMLKWMVFGLVFLLLMAVAYGLAFEYPSKIAEILLNLGVH